MFSRTALSLLALTVSLVYATSFQQRSIEFLESRQSACDPSCNPFSALITTCAGDVTCLCTTAAASSLQTCVSCVVDASPTNTTIAAAQSLIKTYTDGCTTVPGVPAVTIPGSTGTTNTRTSSLTRTSSTSIHRSTVTATTPLVVEQTTVSNVDDSTVLPTGTTIPGIVSNDGRHSYNAKHTGLVAIGCMLGVALVL